MDKTTINLIINTLKFALEQSKVRVDSIAIFGSALTDTMSQESDLDLIIISKDFEDKDIFERALMTMQAEIAIMKQFIVPMDILNLTPEEYKDRKSIGLFESKIIA
jgi:uncharacterized protein